MLFRNIDFKKNDILNNNLHTILGVKKYPEKIKKIIEKNNELTEDFVKDLHEVLVDGLCEGGLYRNTNLRINGSGYIPCDYVKVYDRMKKYFLIYKIKKNFILFLQ